MLTGSAAAGNFYHLNAHHNYEQDKQKQCKHVLAVARLGANMAGF